MCPILLFLLTVMLTCLINFSLLRYFKGCSQFIKVLWILSLDVFAVIGKKYCWYFLRVDDYFPLIEPRLDSNQFEVGWILLKSFIACQIKKDDISKKESFFIKGEGSCHWCIRAKRWGERWYLYGTPTQRFFSVNVVVPYFDLEFFV